MDSPRFGLGRGHALVVLAAMWLVGLVALGAVLLLQNRLDTTRQAQLVLADMGRQIGEVPAIAFSRSLGADVADSEVVARLDAARRRFAAAEESLRGRGGARHADRIQRLADAYFATLRSVHAHVAAGEADVAAALIGRAQQPGGSEYAIRDAVADASRVEGRKASSIRFVAGLGSGFAVVLTLLAFTLALLGSVRARVRAERLATDNHRLLEQSRRDEDRYRDLFENASEPIATVDLDWKITEINSAFADALGYTKDELVGSSLTAYLTPGSRELSTLHRARKLSGLEHGSTYEQEFVAKGGELVPFEVSTRMIEENGVPIGVQGVCRDIRARRQAEEELLRLAQVNRHQALHDALTGLPNRVHFQEKIERALRRSAGGGTFSVLLIDLDRFKEVNDSLGHQSGDELLRELAGRLRAAVREGDSVARLGGDEFGVLLEGITEADPGWPDTIARLRGMIERPVLVQGFPVDVEASIGVASYPTHARDADRLLQRADIAMYVAKKQGRGLALYAQHEDTSDAGRLALLAELRQALAGRELALHFQPEVRAADGRVARVEALVRWEHPRHGSIPPDEFVPLAEQTGLINPLTLQVIEDALRQCKAWEEGGLRLDVAVNLSSRNLADPELVANVTRILREVGVEPGRLTLEITESAIVADPLRTQHTLRSLGALGIRLAMDDFGIGSTSLAHLARLPLDQLKVDRSFVTGMDTDAHGHAIVRSIIGLGQDLGLEVIAEGVETAPVLEELQRLGCDGVQGFHLARPMSAGDLARWLRCRGDETRGRDAVRGERILHAVG